MDIVLTCWLSLMGTLIVLASIWERARFQKQLTLPAELAERRGKPANEYVAHAEGDMLASGRGVVEVETKKEPKPDPNADIQKGLKAAVRDKIATAAAIQQQ